MTIRKRSRSIISACAFAALSSSCASANPVNEWDAMCKSETGRFVYDSRRADGISDPYAVGHGNADLLLGSKAEWVELNYHESARVPTSAKSKIYTEGTGRYVVRFKDPLDPNCKSLLAKWGFDPESRMRVESSPPHIRLDGTTLDAACLSAVKVGDPIPRKSSFGAEPDPAVLEKYDAPYAFVLNRDRFQTRQDGTKIFRLVVQILDSRTRDVIAEEVSLYYFSQGAISSEVICGPARDQSPSGWRTKVFH